MNEFCAIQGSFFLFIKPLKMAKNYLLSYEHYSIFVWEICAYLRRFRSADRILQHIRGFYGPINKEEFIELYGLGEITYQNIGVGFIEVIKEFAEIHTKKVKNIKRRGSKVATTLF